MKPGPTPREALPRAPEGHPRHHSAGQGKGAELSIYVRLGAQPQWC